MIVRMGLLKQKADWSEAKFRDYWRNDHAKLAGTLKNLNLYHQNHVVGRFETEGGPPAGSENIDGMSILWWDNLEKLREAVAGGMGERLVADENHFIGQLRALNGELNVVHPLKSLPAGKLLSLTRRRPEVSAEAFAKWWRTEHAARVAMLPGLRGYRQNLILERQVPKGTPVGYDDLPIDGVAETWFDSWEAADAAFRSPEGKALLAAAKEFVAEDAVFRIATHVVV